MIAVLLGPLLQGGDLGLILIVIGLAMIVTIGAILYYKLHEVK